MAGLNVLNGANSKLYYVMEAERGVTPTSPALKELRSTGGMPELTMEAIVSGEIGAGREVNDISLSNVNVSATITCELAYGAQDDLLAGALSSSWVAGSTISTLSITVDSASKTYTRAAGDFVADGVVVGDYIQFPSMLLGTNSIARFVTAVTATVVTVGGVKEFKPLVDETETTDAIIGDSLSVGNECLYMTVIAAFDGKCGGDPAYLVTTGVEIGASTITADQNAKVAAEFSMIGYDQQVAASLPAGHTIIPVNENNSYSNINSSIIQDGVAISAITSFGYSTDDGAAANFVLDSDLSAFVSRSRITNTITASAVAEDFEMLSRYRNKERLRLEMLLYRADAGSLAFVTNETVLTTVTADRTDGPVTVSIEGQAIGNAANSSLIMYRIPVA